MKDDYRDKYLRMVFVHAGAFSLLVQALMEKEGSVNFDDLRNRIEDEAKAVFSRSDLPKIIVH